MQQITITIDATARTYLITRQYNADTITQETGRLTPAATQQHTDTLRAIAHAISADSRRTPPPTSPETPEHWRQKYQRLQNALQYRRNWTSTTCTYGQDIEGS